MDVSAILIECAFTFGTNAGGCTLAPDAAAEFERIFDETVRIGMARNPAQWDDPEKGRTLALNMIARIATDASEAAGGRAITGAILRNAANQLIAAQQRLEELPPIPEPRFLSPWCFAYQIREHLGA